jgi:hypothetical protein
MIGYRKGLARAIDGRSINQTPRLSLSVWKSGFRIDPKTRWGEMILRCFPEVTHKRTGESLDRTCDCGNCGRKLTKSRTVTLYANGLLIAAFFSDACLQLTMKRLKKGHN